MSVQRYISSSFWSDDWVDSLSVHEKLIYMYLLTNENTNIAGVYRITIKRMKDDTGISREKVVAALEKFSNDKKAFYIDEYIIIPKWPKHQKLGERGKLKLATNAILRSLPDSVKYFITQSGNYEYDTSFLVSEVDTPSIPYGENDEKGDMVSPKQGDQSQNIDTLSSDSDLDLDSDLDSDVKDTHSRCANAPKENEFPKNPKKLFLCLWQQNSDVFNSMSRIESPKDFDAYWEKSKITCDQVRNAVENFADDVRAGVIQRRFIPAMPDRFVLKGWIQKCQKRFMQDKNAPPGTDPTLSVKQKKSL
jgi:hypothetical protein